MRTTQTPQNDGSVQTPTGKDFAILDLVDQGTDPSENGTIQQNGNAIKVQSGGRLLSLTNMLDRSGDTMQGKLTTQDAGVGLHVQDATTDPSNNGEVAQNAGDLKVQSGGSVQNLSNMADKTGDTFTGTVTFDTGGIAFKINDTATQPSQNGQFTQDSGDVFVRSGGQVRNLSNLGGGVSTTKLYEETNATDPLIDLGDVNGDYSSIRIILTNVDINDDSGSTVTSEVHLRVFESGGDAVNSGTNYNAQGESGVSEFKLTREGDTSTDHTVSSDDASGDDSVPLEGTFSYNNPGSNQQTHNFAWQFNLVDATNSNEHHVSEGSATFDKGSSVTIEAAKILAPGAVSSYTVDYKVIAVET